MTGRRHPLRRLAAQTAPQLGVAAAWHFISRFHQTGVPALWPCGTVVRLDVFGLNLDDPDTVANTVDQPRGVWLLVEASDMLVERTCRRVVRAASGFARRRTRTGA